MRENEFEKRIQEEMGEFRLRPSDIVWEKVEQELRKKKKRRVVVFFFLLAGLSLLGYTGYFLFNTNAKQNLVQQDARNLPSNKKTGSTADQLTPLTIENEIASSRAVIKEPALPEPTESKKKGADILGPATAIVNGRNIAGKHKKAIKTRARDESMLITSSENGNRNVATTSEKDNSLSHSSDTADFSPAGIAKNSTPEINKSTTEEEKGPAKTDSTVIAEAKADEAIATTPKRQPESKVTWALDLSVGRSSSRNNAFSLFDMQKSADLLYNMPGNGNTPGGGFGPPTVYPSDIKPGAAFRAGLMAEMKISKRSSISTGLQYVYQSTKIRIGYYSDTTVVVNNSFSQDVRVNALYRGTLQKKYTNRYHFIQIPVQYQLQLNKSEKLPVSWSIGASAGYLVATNGLVYDTTASGIYYRDDAAFNKFQWNLNTGFSFRLGNKNKVQWSIGPELSMGMNKLMKDDYTKKRYLLYGGISGKLYFQKKKK